MISQKLLSNGGKKRKRKNKDEANNHGMTEEEMIAEQQRLFNNAREYNYDSSEQSENGEATSIQQTMSFPNEQNAAHMGMYYQQQP